MTEYKTAHEIVSEAARLVRDDRENTHGRKHDNFTKIARIWNAYLRNANPAHIDLGPEQAADLMELLKVARRQSGSFNPDDYIDGAGYAGVAFEARVEEERLKDSIATAKSYHEERLKKGMAAAKALEARLSQRYGEAATEARGAPVDTQKYQWPVYPPSGGTKPYPLGFPTEEDRTDFTQRQASLTVDEARDVLLKSVEQPSETALELADRLIRKLDVPESWPESWHDETPPTPKLTAEEVEQLFGKVTKS